ncbi:MAG: polysaccharide biosynthesis/export family protein, partial [Acidobacteria bacterium]|nr:polysaccharide biosynthesis/export family protein [Acidobacteriota bacterium]
VGAGDVLDVRVLNRREPRAAAAATTAYKVTPAGLLDYPLLAEPLQVAGLTTDEIAARLGSELKRRAVAADAAEVAVAVLEYESHAIIVSGLVKDPGTKIMRREGVPLYVIIAYAQPLPEAGRVLVVSRATGRSTTFELSDARSLNTLVRPGDVITVQARAKQYFYVAGAVRAPGQKEFHGGLTLTQAVLAAGGVAQPGVSLVTVARQGADGRLSSERYDLREIGAGRTPDPRVEPGDRIEVLR